MPHFQELQPETSHKYGKSKELHVEPCATFESLVESILQLLPIGLVTFGPDLKIVKANPQAAKLIELGDTIDDSLAKGTSNPGAPALNWTRQLRSTVSTGRARSFDNVSYTLDGRTTMLQIVCSPLKKAGTKTILGGAVVIEDITEKVNTQRRLADAEKLAAVGKLAAKVAHELNNPMDGILRYINLALRTIEQENLEKPKQYLTHCRRGLMRMVHIVSDLLEFSRSIYAPFEYVEIERVIEDAIETVHSRAHASNVQILRNYTGELPKIRTGDLFQVFCNLIKNALDAMPTGGELNISTRLTTNNAIAVQLRDTGTGLPPENAQAIFEPFFTTKDKGKGTGLGLSICRDIIQRYRGRITAENAPDRGSIFTVYLPVTDEIA